MNWNYLINCLFYKAQILANVDAIDNIDINFQEREYMSLLHFQACDTLLSQVRKETTAQADKLALGKVASEIYPQAIDLCLRLDSTNLAFTYSEKSKAAVLSESMAGIEAQKFAGIPESLVTFENKLSNNIALYKRILAEQPDSAKEAIFQDKLFAASRSHDSLLTVFENDYPDYYDMKYGREPVGIEDIQNQLDKNTALVEYTLGDSSLYVFVVKKEDGINIKQIPIDSTFFNNIDELMEALTNDKSLGKGPATLEKQFLRSSPALYKKLIAPIEQEIIGIENLTIIPDRELLRLPFDVLFKENKNLNNVDFSSLNYLINKHNLSYHYSASLWYYETIEPKEVQKKESMIAFAPVFEPSLMDYYGYRESASSIDELKPLQADSVLAVNELDTSIFIVNEAIVRHDTMPLPQSKEEVFSVYDTFNKKRNKCRVYYYGAATESNFKANIDGFDIVHIASHSTANSEKPELSYISFAKEKVLNNNKVFRFIPEENEGKLYSGEIYNLRLNAKLVVMSSCLSGVGRMVKGEGMMSITRGFLYAGAANVVFSLWSVDDLETMNLMSVFYQEINSKKQKPYSRALCHSKRKMIEKNGNRFSAPYWAGFHLIGVN